MSRFFSFRFTRQVLVLIGLICLAALIWYVGPLVAIGEFKPLEGRRTRLLMIALVFACWLCKLAVRFWRDRNMNQRLLSQLAARQPEKPQAGQADEQTAELERRFDHALSILKNSRLNTGKPHWYSRLSRQYVYQLPWYVFIGAPGSGKTTALVNSGLTFPLADQFGRAAIRGVGGTRHCDWWFTNEAVMLDTAGRYTTQESNEQSDKAEWEGFLRLLRKFRPRQPINGVLLTVSVDDLIKMSADERHQQSVSFRKRLNELRESLRIRFPVYVLVTKLDLLAGFAEYFAGMGRAERSQVWGFTAPYGDNARAPDFKSWYRPEFELLLARIHRGMPRHLQDEIDLNARALMYSMPQQMAGLEDVLEDLLEPVFSASDFEDAPLLRGIYFTSGTQEGTPFDRVLGAMQRTFQTESRPVIATVPGAGKSYFLQGLLQQLIFPEAHLAGRNLRWAQRMLLARYAGYASVGAALLAAATTWTISYRNNSDYLDETGARVAQLARKLEEQSGKDAGDTLAMLPVLDDARDLSGSRVFDVASPPLSHRFGLYQGNKIAAAADATYLRLLEDALLPAIARQIESDLRQAPQDNLELVYEALKAYLMLYDEKHYNGNALLQWLNFSLQRKLPPDAPKAVLDDLNGHLTRLLADRVVSSPFRKDDALVAKARATLQQYSTAQRTYSRIKRLSAGKEPPEFTLPAVAGPQALLVFTRASGQPLARGVPGLFTFNGYYDLFNRQVGSVAAALAEEESWVLGNVPTGLASARQKLNGIAGNELVDAVRRLYLSEYAKTWEDFLADIRLLRASSLQKSVESARILSAPDSPLLALIHAASRETTLLRESDKPASIAARANGKLQSFRNNLENLIGPADAAAQNVQQAPELIVDKRFDALHRLTPAGQSGAAPIDATLQLVNELYLSLSAADAALKSGATPPPSDIGIRLRAEAARLPQPVRSILDDLSAGGSAQVAGATRGSVGADLAATVGQFCTAALAGRYPFARGSAKDATADDFAKMFAPGGLMDDFFQKHLATMVDTSTRPWSFKKGIDGGAFGGSAGLIAFQRAAVIRDAFFPGGAKTPLLKFAIRLADMDASFSQVAFDVDGQVQKFGPGPQVPASVTWPGARGGQQVSIQTLPASGGASALTGEGPWALHHLFDKARIRPADAQERFVADFNVEGRKITLEVIANSVLNPFRLRELSEFQCPRGL